MDFWLGMFNDERPMVSLPPSAPGRPDETPAQQGADPQAAAPSASQAPPDLLRLQSILEEGACPEPEDGDYWELLDEAEPNGLVVLRRASGHPLMFMSRQSFEWFRQRKG